MKTQNPFYKEIRILKILRLLVSLCFFITTIPVNALVYAHSLIDLPPAGLSVPLSPQYTPAIVRGLKVYPDNPFQFDFIVDSGDSGLSGSLLESESKKLIRYFLTSLTIPEDDLWVNLSPYEADRVIPHTLEQTEMGIEMLAQDYLLKQITASLMSPEENIGQEFWRSVYKKAYERHGTTDIPVDAFNKVWIMPDKAEVYVQEDRAFILEARLRVMLEEDYLALQHHRSQNLGDFELIKDKDETLRASNSSTLASQIIREIIIPELENEVNHGKNFSSLRQIYHSLILSHWYKTALKESIINQVYSDQNKIKGIEIIDEQGNSSENKYVQQIYDQYLDSIRKGVCDILRVEYDPHTKKHLPRKYFTGGALFGEMDQAMTTTTSSYAGRSFIDSLKNAVFIAIFTVGLSLFGFEQAYPQNIDPNPNSYVANYDSLSNEHGLTPKIIEATHKLMHMGFSISKRNRERDNNIPAWQITTMQKEPELAEVILQPDFEQFYLRVNDTIFQNQGIRKSRDLFGIAYLYKFIQQNKQYEETFFSPKFFYTLESTRKIFPEFEISPEVAISLLMLTSTFDFEQFSQIIDNLRQDGEEVVLSDLFVIDYVLRHHRFKPFLEDRNLLEKEVLATIFKEPTGFMAQYDGLSDSEREAMLWGRSIHIRGQTLEDPLGVYPTTFLLRSVILYHAIKEQQGLRQQIRELYLEDRLDNTAEVGGEIFFDKNGEFFIMNFPSLIADDDAYMQRIIIPSFLNLHFHTAATRRYLFNRTTRTFFIDPSPQDFRQSRYNKNPGVMIAAVSEGNEKVNEDILTVHIYQGWGRKHRGFNNVDMNIVNINVNIPNDFQEPPFVPNNRIIRQGRREEKIDIRSLRNIIRFFAVPYQRLQQNIPQSGDPEARWFFYPKREMHRAGDIKENDFALTTTFPEGGWTAHNKYKDWLKFVRSLSRKKIPGNKRRVYYYGIGGGSGQKIDISSCLLATDFNYLVAFDVAKRIASTRFLILEDLRNNLGLEDEDIVIQYQDAENVSIRFSYENQEREVMLHYSKDATREFPDSLKQGYEVLYSRGWPIGFHSAISETVKDQLLRHLIPGGLVILENSQKAPDRITGFERLDFEDTQWWAGEWRRLDVFLKEKETQTAEDQESGVGGIDFNLENIPLQTQGDVVNFSFPLDVDLDQLMGAPGFIPVIINVVPVVNFYLLLGLDEESEFQVSQK